MTDRCHHFTPDAIRNALAGSVGFDPSTSPRMLMRVRSLDGKAEGHPDSPPSGTQATPAAVLVLLYEVQGRLTLVLTRRTSHLSKHAGQISFPGGRSDPEDASLFATALREAREEVGVNTVQLELWAELRPLYLWPTNYLVHPFVVFSAARPDFRPNYQEVEELLEVPLELLFAPENQGSEIREVRGETCLVPHFRYKEHRIWGATANILSQLIARLESSLH